MPRSFILNTDDIDCARYQQESESSESYPCRCERTAPLFCRHCREQGAPEMHADVVVDMAPASSDCTCHQLPLVDMDGSDFVGCCRACAAEEREDRAEHAAEIVERSTLQLLRSPIWGICSAYSCSASFDAGALRHVSIESSAAGVPDDELCDDCHAMALAHSLAKAQL